MIVEGLLVVALGALVYKYRTGAKFKAAVAVEVASLQTEVAALKTKATSTVPVAVSDFAKVETFVLNLVAKL